MSETLTFCESENEEEEGEEADMQASQIEIDMYNKLEEWQIYNKVQRRLVTMEETISMSQSQSILSQNQSQTIESQANKSVCDPDILNATFAETTDAIKSILNSQKTGFNGNFENIDIEQMITTYVLDTGRSANLGPIDFLTFLENHDGIININCRTNIAAPIAESNKQNRSISQCPMPLLVCDVLDIVPGDRVFQELQLFGQSFKNIVIYGHVRLAVGAARRKKLDAKGRSDENNRKYIIDDGTESIMLNYSHKSTKYCDMLDVIVKLEKDNSYAREWGFVYRDQHYAKSSELCTKVTENVGILLKRIKSNTYVPQEPFKAGQKVFVVGAPYKPFPNSKNCIWVTEILVDDGHNPLVEINFKRQLIKLYNEKYLQCK